MATSNVSQMQEFNHSLDDFTVFSEKLEQWFIVNDMKVDDPKRAATLLTRLSNSTYKLLQDLCFPEKPAEKKYGDLLKLLAVQLEKKRSIFAERFKFNQAKQEDAEPTMEWISRLKNLATYCKFGNGLDIALRDRFIVGLRNRDVLNRLFREPEDLTFMRASEIAIQMETARLNAGEITSEGSSTTVKVHSFTSKKKAPGDYQNKNSEIQRGNKTNWNSKGQSSKSADGVYGNKNCYVCGRSGHLAKECKFSKYKCRQCGKQGHLMKVCNAKDKNNSNTKNKCFWRAGEEEPQDPENVEIFSLHSKGEPPVMITVLMGKVNLTMEIDSGSGVSTISQQLYNKYFSNIRLVESKLILVSYTQVKDKPIGMFKPMINYKGLKVENDIHVIAKGGPPLLGRDLMRKLGIGLTNIHSIKKEKTIDMLKEEYSEVFQDRLGKYKYGVVNLKLKTNAKPIFFKPRPLPFVLKELVEKELDRLQANGSITPIESSEWGTPLVPVEKSNGTLRLCGDYKVTLNKFLEEVKYPLPRIEELFIKLQGGEEFTKLDMSEAYNQLCLDEESSIIAAWSTHKGLFRVNRLPYGVSPAAAKFQMMIERLLQGLEGVTSFLDDILVTGRNREEHIDRLEKVLQRMKAAGLGLQESKCEFFKKQVSYLGHQIDSQGLRRQPDKVKAIKMAKRPTTVDELRSFIGSISYYGKFVPNLATIMSPLYALLNKNSKFEWTESCEKAFLEIKDVMCSDMVLAHYDPALPVKLACDASMKGIGAVLVHTDKYGHDRPIAYMAKTLSSAEKNYSMIEKEALAIFQAVKYFHQYLYGRPFTLVTDHRPLLTIFGEHKGIPAMAAGRLQRWALFLSGYNYHIEGIKGKENYCPDYLSRSIEESIEVKEEERKSNYLHFLETSREWPIDSKKISSETRKDPILGKVADLVNMGWPRVVEEELKPYLVRKEELTVQQHCVLWGYRVVIPKSLRPALLEELHASHLGIVKMKSTARAHIWWPNLDREIKNLAKSCISCGMNRPDPNKAALLPWHRPQGPWMRVHIDYLGPVKDKMYLLLIDAYTKWPEVMEVKAANTEQTLDKLRESFARYGIPGQIVSDNGAQFTARSFQEFVKKNGIKHIVTAPGHPATNGQAENSVKNFKSGLYKSIMDPKNTAVNVQTLIARFLLNYRNATHSTTQESPAKLMLGRELRIRLSLVKPNLEATVAQSQDKQAEYFKGKRELILKPGESILVRDYSQVNNKSWKEAEVEKSLGPRVYLCKLKDGRKWRRHLDQIQTRIRSESEQELDMQNSSLNLEDTFDNQGDAIEQTHAETLTIPGGKATNKNERPKRQTKPPDRLNL